MASEPMHASGCANRLPASRCLGCGSLLDGAVSVVDEHEPVAGDVTLCVRCGQIMVFDAERRLRHPDDAEMWAIAGDPELIRVQRVLGLLRADEGGEDDG